MRHKVKEIVDQIVRSVVSLDGLDRIERKLSTEFRKKGYRFQEIKQAFTYIFRVLRTAEGRNAPANRPVRLLSQDESVRLSPEAKSVLLRTYYCAQISHFDLERILGFVSQQDRVVSEQDLAGLLGAGLPGLTEN